MRYWALLLTVGVILLLLSLHSPGLSDADLALGATPTQFNNFSYLPLVIRSRSATMQPPPSPCQMDFNHNGVVDIGDIQELAAHWRQATSGPYDLTGDQHVRVDDIALVAAHLGDHCATPTPSPSPTLTPTPTSTATPTSTPTPPAVDVEVRAFPVEGADPWLLDPNPSSPSSLGVAFTAYKANRVGVLTYTYTAADVVQFDLPISDARPWDVVWLGQKLWFTEEQANKVARLDPNSGDLLEFDIPTTGAMPRGIDGLEQIWFTEYQGQKIGRIEPSNDFLMTEFWPDPACTTLQGPLDIRAPDPIWFTDSAGNRIGKLRWDMSLLNWYFDFWNIPTNNSIPWGLDLLPGPVVWFAETAGQQVGRLDPTSPDLECLAISRDFYAATAQTVTRQVSQSSANVYTRRAGFVPRLGVQTGQFIEYDVHGSSARPGPWYLDVMEHAPDAYSGDLFVGSVWFTEPGRLPRSIGLLLPTTPTQGQLAKIEPAVTELWDLAVQDHNPVVWFTAQQNQDGIIGLMIPLGITWPTPTPTATHTAARTATPIPTPTSTPTSQPLSKGGIRGTVTCQGDPIADAEVTVSGPLPWTVVAWSGLTDRDGHYGTGLILDPGDYIVAVAAPAGSQMTFAPAQVTVVAGQYRVQDIICTTMATPLVHTDASLHAGPYCN